MATLIAQIGDIHLQNGENPAVERAPQIGAAIAADVTPDVVQVVLAICGDIANAGAAAEFSLAPSFLDAVESEIRLRHPSTPIIRVMIPGNHDCDLSGDQEARDAMLTTITESIVPAASIR